MARILYPILDRIVCRPVSINEANKGTKLIQLPDNADDPMPDRGVCLAVGPGIIPSTGGDIPMPIEVGDTVVWQRGNSVTTELDGETYAVVRIGDVLGVVPPLAGDGDDYLL